MRYQERVEVRRGLWAGKQGEIVRRCFFLPFMYLVHLPGVRHLDGSGEQFLHWFSKWNLRRVVSLPGRVKGAEGMWFQGPASDI